MHAVAAYIRLCNYSPLTMLSGISGLLVGQPLDGYLDHNSWKDIFRILFSPIAIPIGFFFISCELFRDRLFRYPTNQRKRTNLKLAWGNHNKPSPYRNYYLFWSLEAEAYKKCPCAGNIIRMFAFNMAVEDDYEDMGIDSESDNMFLYSTEKMRAVFKEQDIERDLKEIQDHCPACVKYCPVKIIFGLPDPIKTFFHLNP